MQYILFLSFFFAAQYVGNNNRAAHSTDGSRKDMLSTAQRIVMIMKIKVKIVGTKIHDAGYRPLLVQKGLESGLTGLNVRDKMEDRKQVVQVLAEGEDREIEEFIKNNHPENAEVEKVERGSAQTQFPG